MGLSNPFGVWVAMPGAEGVIGNWDYRLAPIDDLVHYPNSQASHAIASSKSSFNDAYERLRRRGGSTPSHFCVTKLFAE